MGARTVPRARRRLVRADPLRLGLRKHSGILPMTIAEIVLFLGHAWRPGQGGEYGYLPLRLGSRRSWPVCAQLRAYAPWLQHPSLRPTARQLLAQAPMPRGRLGVDWLACSVCVCVCVRALGTPCVGDEHRPTTSMWPCACWRLAVLGLVQELGVRRRDLSGASWAHAFALRGM